MNKQKIKFLIKENLMEEIPPETINLWRRIKPKVVKEIKRAPSYNWAAISLVGVAVLSLILIVSPQGQVIAQSIMRFFTSIDQSNKPLPVIESDLVNENVNRILPVVEDPASGNKCGSIKNPTCSLFQVQEIAKFPVLVPADLSTSQYVGGFANDDQILLKFEDTKGVLLIFQERFIDDDSELWSVGNSATIKSMHVNGNSAEYVQGAWLGSGINKEGSIPWNQDVPMHTLRWQDHNMRYTIIKFARLSGNSLDNFGMSDLLNIAANLRSINLIANDDRFDGENELTLKEAEEKAGFEFIPPSWLPNGFQSELVTYNSQNNSICQFYKTGTLSNTPALVIAESNWDLPQIEDIQTKAFFEGEQIEIAILDQSVSIPGAENGQSRLIETGLEINAYCGGNPEFANRALLWKKDNRSFILFFPLDANDGRSFTTIMESQRIAAGINGVDDDAQSFDQFDPERLHSKDEAELAAGISVKLPTSMLDTVVFSHLSYKETSDSEKVVVAQYYGQPIGDGRRYRLLMTQTFQPENNLEDFTLAGGFNPVTINGNPGIYQAQCWDSSILVDGVECHQILIWNEEEKIYEIFTHFPGEIPKENILAIAESLR